MKKSGINTGKYVDLMGTAGTIGLHMVSHTVVGAVMGYYLDDWLGTKPWLFIAFLLLGIVAGFRSVFLDTRKIIKQQEMKDAERFRRTDSQD